MEGIVTRKKAFPLRLDPELYDQIRRWAEAEFRSVNGQIEFLLERAVEARLRGTGSKKRKEESGQ
jgi:hypothetical protein